MLLTELLALILNTHLNVCTFYLLGFFLSPLFCILGLCICFGFQHFPKFKRTLSVSSVYAGINAFSKSIQIGLVLVHYGNFAKYARTPPYQNYGHASSLGLNGIDHLKMVDDHGRR